MRAPRSDNHHDIAFFSIGAGAAAVDGRPVERRAVPPRLGGRRRSRTWRRCASGSRAAGALVGASDHGANKSLYAVDPDGLEFEVMYLVPADRVGRRGARGDHPPARPGAASWHRFGGVDEQRRPGEPVLPLLRRRRVRRDRPARLPPAGDHRRPPAAVLLADRRRRHRLVPPPPHRQRAARHHRARRARLPHRRTRRRAAHGARRRRRATSPRRTSGTATRCSSATTSTASAGSSTCSPRPATT